MKKQIKIVIIMLCFLSSFCAHSSELVSMGSGMLDLCKKSAGEYPMTTLCATAALPVVAYSLYNKISIIDTIKNDLGFNESNDQPEQTRNYKFSTDVLQDLWTASRLYAYSLPFRLCVILAFNTLADNSNMPPQFEIRPSFTELVFATPIMEEIIFTYGWSNIIKREHNVLAASIVTPILFGAAHHHDDPKMWAFLACGAAASSFLRVRNYHASDHQSLAPIFSHMLHNAVVEAIQWSLS